MQTIEARAILSASDKTGGVFSQIAAKIKGMNAAAAMANRAVGNSVTRASMASRTAAMANSTIIAAAGRVAGPAAIAAGGVSAFRQFAAGDLRIRRIGITADASEKEVAGLGKTMRDTAYATGHTFDKIAKGMESLTAGGMDLKEALPAIPAIAMTAQAAGAEVEDMATTTLALNQNLKISTDRMQSAFDVLVKGGKAGKFELKDMARHFPSIAPAAVAAGMKGEEGLMRIVAALQTIRNGTGTTEEAAASMQNIFAKMESEETVKKFEKFNVNLRKEMERARKEGKDLLETFTDLSEKAIKGDLSKIPQLFSDMEFARGMRALLSYRDLNRKVMGELKNSAGSTAQDFAKVMDTPAMAVARLSESFSKMVVEMGAALDRGGLTGKINAITEALHAAKKASDMLPSGTPQSVKNAADGTANPAFKEEQWIWNNLVPTLDEQKQLEERVPALQQLAENARKRGREFAKHRQEQLERDAARLFELQNRKNVGTELGKPLFTDHELSRFPSYVTPEGPELPSIKPLLPTPDPRKTTMPPVQDLNVDVKGEAAVKVTVEAGSELIRVVDNVKNAIAKLSTNGAGSTGRSSPDARPGDTGIGP